MAENNVEPEHEWGDWALDAAEDTLVAMETLLATLRAFEDVLRQQEVSVASSTEYCDNFCQALMHYAGSRNSMEHGLPLLEVYCLSINCFAAARSHLTAESDRVALVLKRLALSCFELLLSVPENEIPFEAWVQFHQSVQIAHDNLLQFGSTDLQALLQITGEGGAWSNSVLTALLTGQPTNQEDVEAYINLEGEGFMEMRVKHLEKMGESAKAVVLAKACSECSFIGNQAMFRQTYVSLLCHLLPNEEAITEISRLDCKDVLEVTCNLETEGEENTAFILCTTFLTQQLQQQSLYSSWDLILLWSKLQRKLDPSLVSLLERCLQLGAIAKTVQHLLYLVRVIQTEADDLGTPASVELCVKALQLPKQDDSETRISICKMVSSLLPNDLEVLRACQLTELLLGSSREAFTCLKELYLRPDQKYDQEKEVIPNSLRCELLLALKAYWPFDPEFWDWKTLKYHCNLLLGLMPESDGEQQEEEVAVQQEKPQPSEVQFNKTIESNLINRTNGTSSGGEHQDQESSGHSDTVVFAETKRHKICCKICKRWFIDSQIVHHSKRHSQDNTHLCPVCLEVFKSRKDLVPHMKKHIRSRDGVSPNNVKEEEEEDDNDVEPGEITIDPSLLQYYKTTRDPDVLHHIVQQASTTKEKHADGDEHITFDYIYQNYRLQNRDEYPCPGKKCKRVFKHSKYLYVHLKSEHKGDDNAKHFHQMRDKREKCVFCRRHFVSAYHHRKHRKVHHGDQPYTCVVVGCGERFKSTHDLISHKQVHGYQLNYQCELKGCYVTYTDLGQLYHHEAQHFRDAAFTCPSTECKKFYLSRKEFLQHLSTHNITFKEDDFEAQRKAKRKLFKVAIEPPATAGHLSDSPDNVNGDILNSSSSSSHESTDKECKATMTLVAVCFDGCKFTCGFEKCGMTFSRTRDVQRHLNCCHPEHLKLESRDQKHDNSRENKSREMDESMGEDSEDSGNDEPCTTSKPVRALILKKTTAFVERKEVGLLGRYAKNDGLREILVGLSRLSLDSLPSSSPSEAYKSGQDSSLKSLHEAILAKPPVVLLKKRPHLSGGKVNVKLEVKEETDSEGIESLGDAKPYVCVNKGCGFRTAQSYSLQRHYNCMHGWTMERARKMTSLKTTFFKPYACQLCSKSHREKSALKSHYIHVHNMSKALVDKIGCGMTKPVNLSNAISSNKKLIGHLPKGSKKKKNNWQHKHKSQIPNLTRKNGQNLDNHSLSEDQGDDETETAEEHDSQRDEGEDGNSQQVRTKRLVAKNNLCYILDKFSKPFHCVAKNCGAAFSTQSGLVRHLQSIHRYNRSQLLLEDSELNIPDVKKEQPRKRPYPDEPQPQFRCHFGNCHAVYHLKSSLARHTRDCHTHSPEEMRCSLDGCSKVFSNRDGLKKHTLYCHYKYYDSLVLQLQSTHKKSIPELQVKLIPSENSQKLNSHSTEDETPRVKCEETVKSKERIKRPRMRSGFWKKPKCNPFSTFILKSPEEALQMCQDRTSRVPHPCMVQNCDSVVSYQHSLQRHYISVHNMSKEDIVKYDKRLVFTSERLEELIQRKSAQPPATGVCGSKEVQEEEGQGESDGTGDPKPQRTSGVRAAATETPIGDEVRRGFTPVDVKREPCSLESNGVLVTADDIPRGESSVGIGRHIMSRLLTPQIKLQKRLSLDQIRPLLRPVTVDLSPPISLRITAEQIRLGSKDNCKLVNGSTSVNSLPVRQPLKRKNDLPDHPSNEKDIQPASPMQSFDIGAYRPIGFESSFLQFIQDTAPKDENAPTERQGVFKHHCSLKENCQIGMSHSRSKRSDSPLPSPRSMTGDSTSIQNLKSILDKALAGCGDLAIKQLQYLRPVVVLGKPVCTTAADFFPSDTNKSKLLLGS